MLFTDDFNFRTNTTSQICSNTMSEPCSGCVRVHDAIEKGCISCVKRILEENRELKDEVDSETGHIPLTKAVLSTDPSSSRKIINCLVAFGADVNKELEIRDSNHQGPRIASRTPLCLAVEQNNLEAIKGLNSGPAGKSPIKTSQVTY